MNQLKCGHDQAYLCHICKNCCQCTHEYQERPNGWYAKCKKILKWHKCHGPTRH